MDRAKSEPGWMISFLKDSLLWYQMGIVWSVLSVQVHEAKLKLNEGSLPKVNCMDGPFWFKHMCWDDNWIKVPYLKGIKSPIPWPKAWETLNLRGHTWELPVSPEKQLSSKDSCKHWYIGWGWHREESWVSLQIHHCLQSNVNKNYQRAAEKRNFIQAKSSQTGETQPPVETKIALHQNKCEATYYRENSCPDPNWTIFYANEISKSYSSDWS